MSHSNFMVFSGNANPELAKSVAAKLGMPLGKALVTKFSDGEVRVEINEKVRGKDVFIIQSTCSPTNDNLMEIVLMADALKRASAERITACIPYFGYARQDRRPRSTRVAISARVVDNMLERVGVDLVIIIDVHADQIQGFFDIPVDNIYASPVLLHDLKRKSYKDLVVVSPDIGGVVRARSLAERLGCELSIIDKRRPRPNESEVMNLIGSVKGRNCVIMDDMVDTAGTVRRHSRNEQCNARANIGGGHIVVAETHLAVMADHHGTVRVAEYDLRPHVDELVHKEQPALEHLLMYQHTPLALGGHDKHHAQKVRSQARPRSIGDGHDGAVYE